MTQFRSNTFEGLKTQQKLLNVPSVIPLTAGNELIGKEVIGQELITQELLLHPSSFFASRELVPLGDRPDSYLLRSQKESGWYYYLLMNGMIYLIDFYTQQGQRVAVIGSELAALVDELLALWDEQSKFIVLSKSRSLFRWRQIVIEIILITREELPSSEFRVLDKGGRKMLEMPNNLALVRANGVLESQKTRVDIEVIRQMFADERGLPASQPAIECSQDYYAVQITHQELHKPKGFEIEIEIASYQYPALPYQQALPSSQQAICSSTELVAAGPLDIEVRGSSESAIQPRYGFEIEVELQSRRALPMANELPSPPVNCTSIVPFCQDIQNRYGWEVEIQLGKNLSTRALHSSNSLPFALPYPSIKAQENCTALVPYRGASLIPSKENALMLYNRSASKPLTTAQNLNLNLASYLRKLTPSSRLQLLKPIHLEDLDYVSTLVPKFSDPVYSPDFENMEITTQKLVSHGPKNFSQLAYPLRFKTPVKNMLNLEKPYKNCFKKEAPRKSLSKITLEKPKSKLSETQDYAIPTSSFDEMKKKMASRILESQLISLSTYRMKDRTISPQSRQATALVPYYKDTFDKKLEQLSKVCKTKTKSTEAVDSILMKHFHNRLALGYTNHTNSVQHTLLTAHSNTNLPNYYTSVHEVDILSESEHNIYHRGSVESESLEDSLKPDIHNMSFEESALEQDDRFGEEEKKEELLIEDDPGVLNDDYEFLKGQEEKARELNQKDKDYDICLQEVDIADNNFEILN